MTRERPQRPDGYYIDNEYSPATLIRYYEGKGLLIIDRWDEDKEVQATLTGDAVDALEAILTSRGKRGIRNGKEEL